MSFPNPDALVRNLATYFLRRNEMGRLANSNCPIINGDLNIWQRGTPFAAVASATYTVDRWRYDKVGTMVHTVSQDADVPTVVQSGHKSNYSIKIDCTTADAAIAAGDFIFLSQRIEGYNFQPLVAKTFYLSFWVKATKTGIYCVSFRNSGNDRSYVVEYTVNSASTWERKIVTIPFDFTGGTWDYTNGEGLSVSWSLAAGATFRTTANVWQNGNFLATANQVNACDSTANDFFLSQAQFRPDNPNIFVVNRLFDEELAACQRYYEVIGGDNANFAINIEGYHAAISNLSATIYFRTTKRAVPTVTKNGTWGVVNCAQPTVDQPSTNSCRIIALTAAGGNALYFTNSADDTVTIDAEL
jgi:hypothetical protein